MNHGEHNHHHHHHAKSELKTDVTYDNGKIMIKLEDNNGAPPELAVQHEKEMHFIIISNDLEEYYHLHPVKEKHGLYSVNQVLSNGTYQAFVDITPENKEYQIKPNTLQVGTGETRKVSLGEKDNWTKERGGKTVTLHPVDAMVGEEVPLVFDTQGEKSDPYLGALGHVVIIDENVEHYIHVHPETEVTTTFNAHFQTPGMYKIWAEFKFGENVEVYPFIIEVKE
ncbi:hypothetical protein SAMN04487944_115100 [Gracilibacillus ureilyticus]|uniref:Secreted protein n=1 Tax=Gracilibacillus ureilyticus TaxID=531814 RepID=A0A1H9U0J6_9BACI|nr:hypothetical protein [Gracilibacillus ureilyticus]SES02778.1 hypothetical protein SAMN04487944_115100 [Gracilibacillus ureilyticus]